MPRGGKGGMGSCREGVEVGGNGGDEIYRRRIGGRGEGKDERKREGRKEK